ncbi:hypothetical protein GCM10009092_27040 [Bowmanella denitrificans]|uniref:Uncharacterized protein n=2 Tax=Bowmanella denitrificans TaxID=366582 RepID=A0ABN0XE05_9ALTE
MWNEQKTTKAWDERVAREERQRYQTAFQNLVGELNLDNWGAMQVKPDAIERQLTPEQKKKKQQDPSYSPPGPFSFGPDDIVSDESNTSARYFVSLTIFEFLEEKLGLKKLQEAFNDIRKSESCSSAELKKLIRDKYNTDISSFFK